MSFHKILHKSHFKLKKGKIEKQKQKKEKKIAFSAACFL